MLAEIARSSRLNWRDPGGVPVTGKLFDEAHVAGDRVDDLGPADLPLVEG